MDNDTKKAEHILQQMGVLIEFDIVSSTTLEDFIEKYKEVAETSDNIADLSKVSKLLSKENVEIPGFIRPTPGALQKSDPELDKIAYAMIEFIMKKTTDPNDWTYILNFIITKMGLEFGDEDEDSPNA
tara:strand:- start:2991 stop:3374 length:384 start_codon:yes stop_codon:yes gene_type:complete